MDDDRKPASLPRVVVLGAESTGKTTLARDLAAHYGVVFVPEFGRWYTEAMPAPELYEWCERDFVVIAETQNRFEDDAAKWLGGPMVCDTNSYVTAVFCEAYIGVVSEEVLALAAPRRYDLVLICDPGTPFEQDLTTGLRRDGAQRTFMHDKYLAWAQQQGVPWQIVSGTTEERVATAVQLVDRLLEPTPA